MNKRLIVLLLTAIVLFHGCKTQKVFVRSDYPNPTYRQLLSIHEQWQQSLKTFSAKGRITIDSPQFSGNFEGRIFARGNDSLLISVSGFMGTEVGKVFVGKDRFIFYNKYENQFITGHRDDFEQTHFLQFPITLSELREVFLAQDHFTILKKEEFRKTQDGYFLKAKNGSYDYNIWFDGQTLLIRKIEYLKEGQIMYSKEYKRYEEHDGLLFPKLINFVRPQEKQGMSIIYKEINLNRPIPNDIFKIKIGDNAKQIVFPTN